MKANTCGYVSEKVCDFWKMFAIFAVSMKMMQKTENYK